MSFKKKTNSFSQFDQGKGTKAAQKGKKPAGRKPAGRKPASKKPAAKKKPTYEDKLRSDARSYRKKVLRGGMK